MQFGVESLSDEAPDAADGPQALTAPPRLRPRPVAVVPPDDRDGSEGSTPATARAARALESPGRVRHVSGLDGLRAIAVLAVVVYHLDFASAPGGFLGVDVFFVISGFLITWLLAGEILATGTVRLRAFYVRRARRLGPGLLAVLTGIVVASTTVWRDQLPMLRGGVTASLTSVTNWWLVFDQQSYFVSSGRPSMVQHLWSLAIEEQFYLVWSLVVLAVGAGAAARFRGVPAARRLRVLSNVALACAVLSTVAMAAIAQAQDVPFGASASRVYFGSDTHSAGLFLGAAAGVRFALARAATPVPRGYRWTGFARRLPDIVGLTAVVVLLYEFGHLDEFSPLLYRGGFLGIDIVALVAVLCAVRAGGMLGRTLDIRPLRWIGERSYGIYLWQWPIVVVTRPGVDVHAPLLLVNLARFALIIAVAALSYRFIEVPLRRGAVRRAVPGRGAGWAGLTAVVTVAFLAACAIPATAPGPLPAAAAPARPAPLASPSAGASRPAPVRRTGHPASSPRAAAASPGPGRIALSAFGDSVLLGARDTLKSRVARLTMDAVEGRRAGDVLDDIDRVAKAGGLASYVLIHIGDNGIVSPGQLADTLQRLSSRRRVVLVNDRVPRPWQDPNNAIFKRAADRFRNVAILDWHARSAGHYGWVFADGLHLTAAGADAYASLVLGAVTGRLPG